MVKRLQLHRLRYNLKRFKLLKTHKALKFWWRDVRFAHERCVWCGAYLHPQQLFRGVKGSPGHSYWGEKGGDFVCGHCHYCYGISEGNMLE